MEEPDTQYHYHCYYLTEDPIEMLLDTASNFVAVYILLTDPTIFSGELSFSSKIMTSKEFERHHRGILKPIFPWGGIPVWLPAGFFLIHDSKKLDWPYQVPV